MTFGEARDWLREHSGIVAREESIGRYYFKVRAKVGLEWKMVRKETSSLSGDWKDHAEAICKVVEELQAEDN